MKPTINRITPWLTVGLTAGATALRLLTLPLVQAEAVGEFGFSIWLLVIMCLAAVVLAAMGFVSRLPQYPMAGSWMAPLGLAASVTGGVLLLDTVLALVQLNLTGTTPPPNAQILNDADRITLWLTLLFGLLAGLWLVVLGIRWMRGSSLTTVERFGALLPVLWIWCRLARYELSYASATNAKRSFYDFFMLIFLMLFLLAFARYAAETPPSGRAMRIYASIAAVVGISSPLTRLGMHILGDTESYNASQLAGVTDLAIGIFALLITFYLYREQVDFPLEEEKDLPDTDPEESTGDSATPLADQLITEWFVTPPADDEEE